MDPHFCIHDSGQIITLQLLSFVGTPEQLIIQDAALR